MVDIAKHFIQVLQLHNAMGGVKGTALSAAGATKVRFRLETVE
jgi:hypothetical protein